jgi:hypothetical protein
MKTKLAILALAATSVAANAAYIFSSPTPETSSTTQPTVSRVYGVEFTLNAPAFLDTFAVYDYLGDGWTAGDAKQISLYSLTGATYTRIQNTTLTTSTGLATLTDFIGVQDFKVASFGGSVSLAAGTYFIGMSEIKSGANFHGFTSPEGTLTEPTIPQLDSYRIAQLGTTTGVATVPNPTFASNTVRDSGNVFVIPSLVNVPEAGSSVMALALGAMVLRFRSRRA